MLAGVHDGKFVSDLLGKHSFGRSVCFSNEVWNKKQAESSIGSILQKLLWGLSGKVRLDPGLIQNDMSFKNDI